VSVAANGLPADLVVPRYGSAALSDVLPSVLAALGLPGEHNVLALPPIEIGCVLLVDGLGWDLLRAHRADAPFLNGLADGGGRNGSGDEVARLTAGFPTTTTTSLTSLGVGAPAGEHGMTGYQMYVADTGRVLNALQWDLGRGPDPIVWQPVATTLQRAEAAGVSVTMIAPAEFAGTGLTQAALRGGDYLGLDSYDRYASSVRSVLGDRNGPALAYVYYGALDRTGHTLGVASQAWRDELRRVDAVAAKIAETLPPDALLLVTADHGMVDIDRAQLVEVADEPALNVGVRVLAGEGRCRYVHTAPGAARDVLAIWHDELDGPFCVLSRDETIDAGLLGPVVTEDAASRVGDVVVLARGAGAVFDRRVDAARVRNLIGQHGSLTSAETYVPLLQYRAG
jgi:hypothetical protein